MMWVVGRWSCVVIPAASQVVAIEFQTIAAADDYWRT
jgi:hypothetical protein